LNIIKLKMKNYIEHQFLYLIWWVLYRGHLVWPLKGREGSNRVQGDYINTMKAGSKLEGNKPLRAKDHWSRISIMLETPSPLGGGNSSDQSQDITSCKFLTNNCNIIHWDNKYCTLFEHMMSHELSWWPGQLSSFAIHH
jgi:hypothetical protein